MKRNVLSLSIAGFLLSVSLSAEPWHPSQWPSLTHYDGQHLQMVALPLGGIGTGTVSLGGRGELRDWEIMNVPAKGYSTVNNGNDAPFFAIYTKAEGLAPETRMLAGPIYPQEYLHMEGRPVPNSGLPRFAHASFDAAYPFGQVNLSDENMPVEVRIKGFNPLIPGDSENSGLPLAVISYEVKNISDAAIEVAVCGAMHNFVGRDGRETKVNWKGEYVPQGAKDNENEYREDTAKGIKSVFFFSKGVDENSPAWGNFTLSTDSDQKTTFRTFSADNNWSSSVLNFWDDFSDDGLISNPEENVRYTVGNDQDPMGALSVKSTLGPGEVSFFNFYLTWNFPNRMVWSSEIVGNHYSGLYPDSFESACRFIPQISQLEARTLAFVNALLSSSYPDCVKEASLYNLNVLRSQTVFRIRDGHMLGWEGVMDRFGSCSGSCTHVWNYELATPMLFGDLARSMRDVEFKYALNDDGAMAFRVKLPLDGPQNRNTAADGQLGCIMKLYREWQLSGDNAFLVKYWDACKKALSFSWIEKGWDGNQDGVMEGSQHNTMDVNYFGPNPQMGFWYMGALRAAEEMAKAVKDKNFEKKCRALYESGSVWMEANLFNGEYYEQKITDPQSFALLDEQSPDIPAFQLGKACLVDQLVGQYMAHLCGLGYLGDKDNKRTTLESIMKYNFADDLSGHFNNMRSYVFADERALLMASWPKGRLEVPFPYFGEAMTGFEYTAAVGMIFEGMEAEALKCVEAIRERFDGAKRNPFSEPECGHHYARSMASWALIPALGRFQYSGVNQSFAITGADGRWFWSNGSAWGVVTNQPDESILEVIEGSLDLKSVIIGQTEYKYKKALHLESGQSVSLAPERRKN